MKQLLAKIEEQLDRRLTHRERSLLKRFVKQVRHDFQKAALSTEDFLRFVDEKMQQSADRKAYLAKKSRVAVDMTHLIKTVESVK